MDLLNKIFVINQDQRITVPNIKAHPWYTKPLLDKYQAAEETLAKRQEQLNAYVSQRQLNSVRPGRLGPRPVQSPDIAAKALTARGVMPGDTSSSACSPGGPASRHRC